MIYIKWNWKQELSLILYWEWWAYMLSVAITVYTFLLLFNAAYSLLDGVHHLELSHAWMLYRVWSTFWDVVSPLLMVLTATTNLKYTVKEKEHGPSKFAS